MSSSLFKKILVFLVLYFGSASRNVSAVAFCNPLSGDCTGADGKGLDPLIGSLMNFLFGIALVVCPALIVWGGFLIATNNGDEKKITEGKRIITYAVIGLIIIGVSNAIKAIIFDIAGS